MATKQFYFICLIFLTFLGGCFLLLLKRKLSNNQDSKGMLFVALGLFSFATIGFYKLFDPPIPNLFLSDIDRIFSVFTNIFFVAALPFFSSAFIKFRNYFSIFRKTDQWVNSVFIFFAFLAALFSVIERNVESEFGKNLIISIDSIFSTTTIGLVTYALYKSISKVWKDTLSKVFIGLFLMLFPISQLLIPLTAIFPDKFNFLYFTFLIVLLIGLAFFIFVAIAYYMLVDKETHHKDDVIYTENNLHINNLKIGFDSIKKVYFIELEFLRDDTKFIERVENRKILLPFSNWILFSVAKKLNVKLNNQDIALSKFRMVEYWNKDSDTKLNQDILFINDMGSFQFSFDANSIEVSNLTHLENKLMISEAIQKNIENFAFLFPDKDKTKLDAIDVFNLINKKK